MNPFDTPPGLASAGFHRGCPATEEDTGVKTSSELNRDASPFIPSTEPRKHHEVDSLVGRPVGETVHYESCTSRFNGAKEESMIDSIAVYQPTSHILQSCVTAGRCCIPWHDKAPHIHMVPMLYNAGVDDCKSGDCEEPEKQSKSIRRDKESRLSQSDSGELMSARKMLRMISGRWYCVVEGPDLEYEIRGSCVIKTEKDKDDSSDFSPPLWKKRLVIKNGSIYWSASQNYVLSKSKFSRNEINWESTSTGRKGWMWLRVPHSTDTDSPSTHSSS